MMVDNAVYLDSRSSEELVPVAGENELHVLGLEGAIKVHQHPKPEGRVGTQFLTLQSYFAVRAL
jgi:hypothetical protein